MNNPHDVQQPFGIYGSTTEMHSDQPWMHAATNKTFVSPLFDTVKSKRSLEDALDLAIEEGNAAVVKCLLHSGVDVHRRTARGFSPLFLAVKSGWAEIIKLLLDHGCCMNELVHDNSMEWRFTLLHWATENNLIQTVDFLLQMRADVNQRDSFGNTCLHLASRLGRFDIVRLLLHYGARVHETSASNQTALYFAVDNGHRDIVKLLVGHGGNLKDRGMGGTTLLQSAIKSGNVDLVEDLLHWGAKVNAADRFGKSPLHVAISQKNWRALELLLERGAKVYRKDVLGKTPLHVAVESSCKEIYDLLLRRGADVNDKDNRQQTPLHYAVKQGCYGTVELLLRHGANANACDEDQQSPLYLALANYRFNCIELLMAYEAKFDSIFADEKIRDAMKQSLARYLIPKLVVKMNVHDPKYLGIVDTEKDFVRQCEEELKKLKLTKLHNEQTYYEFLCGNRRRLVNFVANDEVCDMFQDHARTNSSGYESTLKSQFPVYADMLYQKYSVGMIYAPLLDASYDKLINLFELPAVPTDIILGFLDDDDMRNVIEAMPGLAN